METWTDFIRDEQDSELTVRDLNSILGVAESYAERTAETLGRQWNLDAASQDSLREKIMEIYEILLQGCTAKSIYELAETTLIHQYPETLEALREQLLGNPLSDEMMHFAEFGINRYLPDHLQNQDCTRTLFEYIQSGLERVVEHGEALVKSRKSGMRGADA